MADEPAPQLAWKFAGVTATTSEVITRKQKITLGKEAFEATSTLKCGFTRKSAGEDAGGRVTIKVIPKPIEFKVMLPGHAEIPYTIGGQGGGQPVADNDITRPLKVFLASSSHDIFLGPGNKVDRIALPPEPPEDVDPQLWAKLADLHGTRYREYLQLFNPMAKAGTQWEAKCTVRLGDNFLSFAVFQVNCKLAAQDPARPDIVGVDLKYDSGKFNSTESRFTTKNGLPNDIPIEILQSGGKVEFDKKKGQIIKCDQQIKFSIDGRWNDDDRKSCHIECDWSHTCDVDIVLAKAG